MSFDRAWVLLLAWIPLAWGYFEYRRTTRRLGLALEGGDIHADPAGAGAAAVEHFDKQGSGGRAGGYIGKRIAAGFGAGFEGGVGLG